MWYNGWVLGIEKILRSIWIYREDIIYCSNVEGRDIYKYIV